jgi:hypothetical protein
MPLLGRRQAVVTKESTFEYHRFLSRVNRFTDRTGGAP